MIAAGNQAKHLAGFGPKVDGFDQVPLGDIAATRNAIAGDSRHSYRAGPGRGRHPGGGLAVLAPAPGTRGRARHSPASGRGADRDGPHGQAVRLSVVWDEARHHGHRQRSGRGLSDRRLPGDRRSRGRTYAGSHGSTFGGNPLAAAAGNAALDVVLEPDFFHTSKRWACFSNSVLRKSWTGTRTSSRKSAEKGSCSGSCAKYRTQCVRHVIC